MICIWMTWMNLIKFQINECTAEPGTWDVTAFKGQITVLYCTVPYRTVRAHHGYPTGFCRPGYLGQSLSLPKTGRKKAKRLPTRLREFVHAHAVFRNEGYVLDPTF